MSWSLYLTYVAACVAIVIVPGPSVTVIIANSLTYGPRAGLLKRRRDTSRIARDDGQCS